VTPVGAQLCGCARIAPVAKRDSAVNVEVRVICEAEAVVDVVLVFLSI
jgi:hypothetical protein